MTIADLVALIQRRLRDDTGRQWTTEYVTDALNAAFSALCATIPQAHTVHRDLLLKAGTEQRIDADLHRIIHILHNKCPETGEAKRSIIKADLSVMDKVAPHWRQDDPRGYIIHYLLNPIDESMFYVWPPVAPSRGEAPVVPPEPVDPGPLGFGADVAPDGFFTSDVRINPVNSAAYQLRLVNEDMAGISSVTGSVVDVRITDKMNATGVISIDTIMRNEFGATGGNFVSIDRSPTDSSNLTWEEVNNGDVLRLELSSSFSYTRFDTNVFQEGVTQADIDAYQLALAEFNAAVAALEEFNNTLGSNIIRGVFTKTPCIIDAATLPTIPVEPAAPVDPTTLVAPTDPRVDFSAFTVARTLNSTLHHYNIIFTQEQIVSIGGDGSSSINLIPDGSIVEVVMGAPDPLWTGNQNVTIDSGARPEDQPLGGGLDSRPLVDSQGANIQTNDPRIAEGNTIIIERFQNLGTWVLREDIPPAGSAPTQEQLDEHAEDVAEFNAAVAARDSVIALVEQLSFGKLSLTDEVPFDNAHLLPLQEFAIYYCHVRDDEQTANTGRAMQHWQNFFQLLNKREDSELLVKAAEGDSE